MMGHKICFYGKMWLVTPKSSPLPFLSRALSDPIENGSKNETSLAVSQMIQLVYPFTFKTSCIIKIKTFEVLVVKNLHSI